MYAGRHGAARWLLRTGLLAVALQICLPVAMLRLVAARFDPLGHVALCLASASNDGASSDDGGIPSPRHGNICPVCQIAATPLLALLDNPSALSLPSLVTRRIASDPAQSAGPRGPPQRGVQARAPPIVS